MAKFRFVDLKLIIPKSKPMILMKGRTGKKISGKGGIGIIGNLMPKRSTATKINTVITFGVPLIIPNTNEIIAFPFGSDLTSVVD